MGGTESQFSSESSNSDSYGIGERRQLCCKSCYVKHHVDHDLADGNAYHQSLFIQKVFGLILVKALVVLLYLSVVELLDDFKDFYQDTFYYHFASIGVYLMIKIAIRLTKNFRRRHCCMHVILHMLDIFACGDFLACAMTHYLTDYAHFSVPRKILLTIIGTCIFFIYVGWFVAFDMHDGVMVGTAILVTGLTATHQVLYGTIRGTGFAPNMGDVSEEWCSALIVVGVAEIIMMIIMTELKGVLTGRRFSVWPSDWFFTGIYII